MLLVVHKVRIVYAATKLWFNITIATDESVIPLIVISPSSFAKLAYVFGGSPWFSNKIKDYDFVCTFFYAGNNQWEYSFYSEKEDVECYKLAKSINPQGGGHKGAAGCITDKFIF